MTVEHLRRLRFLMHELDGWLVAGRVKGSDTADRLSLLLNGSGRVSDGYGSKIWKISRLENSFVC